MAQEERVTSRLRCVECKAAIAAKGENGFFPFCSARCRQVDLGRWLNEEVSVPVSQEGSERALPPDEWEE